MNHVNIIFGQIMKSWKLIEKRERERPLSFVTRRDEGKLIQNGSREVTIKKVVEHSELEKGRGGGGGGGRRSRH